MNKRTSIIVGVTAGVIALGAAATAVALLANPAPAPVTVASTPSQTEVEATASSTPTPEAYDTTASLLYIIEEEKLAHDVYVTMNDLWGSSIFANILDSETTHQSLVLPLLETRGIADPRSAEVGVFANPELQALYDELVSRGSASLDEAIQVGILIEEKDIADLTVAIAAEDEADVISAYERLLAGSENHLASFQRRA